jgi:hypothetical protein
LRVHLLSPLCFEVERNRKIDRPNPATGSYI